MGRTDNIVMMMTIVIVSKNGRITDSRGSCEIWRFFLIRIHTPLWLSRGNHVITSNFNNAGDRLDKR